MSELERTLYSLAELLERMGYTYAVMGGLAVRAHSIPRPTYDVDLTLSISRDELPILFEKLVAQGHTVADTYLKGWVEQVAGMPLIKVRAYLGGDKGIDIDLFIAETDFQKALLERRIQAEVGDHVLWLVTPEDLILLKVLASRPRDLMDIADILFTQGQLDEAYMRNWAETLGVADRLERALADLQ